MRRPRFGARTTLLPEPVPSSKSCVQWTSTRLPATRLHSRSARFANTTTSWPRSRTIRTPSGGRSGSGPWAVAAEGAARASRRSAVTTPVTPPLMGSRLIEYRLQVHHRRAVDRLQRPHVKPLALDRQDLHLVQSDRVGAVGGPRVEDALHGVRR